MELRNIDIRSEYYTTIHNMNPPWWMRWGIFTVAIIFCALILIGWFVKYPDIITCELKLTTNTPSITLPLYPKAQIERVLVKSGDRVSRNSHLLSIRNDAKYEDVILLSNALQNFQFKKNYIISFFEEFLNKDLQLGSVIEPDWNAFSNELLVYYKIEALNSYRTQVSFLEKELSRLYILKQQYEYLISLDARQRVLIQKKAYVDSILYQQRVTSSIENILSNQDNLTRYVNLEANRLALSRTNLEITKLQNELENYHVTERENLISQQMSIRKSLNKLKSSIEAWKKSYLLISSTEGQVSFLQDLRDGRFAEGNAITIVPTNDVYHAIINIPIVGAGKVFVGQRVIVKINDYPYKEYGVLEGRLAGISNLSNDKFYLGKVMLNDSNRSSYSQKIVIHENMNGVGEIVTNDRNLIERLFQTILYGFRKR